MIAATKAVASSTETQDIDIMRHNQGLTTRKPAQRVRSCAIRRPGDSTLPVEESRRPFASVIGTINRQSAIATIRATAGPTSQRLVYRCVSLAVGSMLIGVAVGMLVQADLGLSPYDVLSDGIAQRIGISLGQAGWAIAAALFVVATAMGRRPSGWGLAYVFVNGLAIDAASGLLNAPETLPGRWLLALSAVLVMSIAVNLVVQSGTTGGPFELLMRAGEDRGVDPTFVRYGLDVGGLVLGVLLGGSFGLATVAFAGLMGVFLQYVSQAFVDHRYGRAARATPGSGPPPTNDRPGDALAAR